MKKLPHASKEYLRLARLFSCESTLLLDFNRNCFRNGGFATFLMQLDYVRLLKYQLRELIVLKDLFNPNINEVLKFL